MATPRKDGRAARWAGQRQRRRQEFVEAALRAIARHGPEVSTEQIAAEAGVARTQLYKHFADAPDLRSAIGARAKELLSVSLALWELRGTPLQMIHTAIDAHIGWLSEHQQLYRYLSRHSLLNFGGTQDPITDVKTAIARQLTALFEAYLQLFAMDTMRAEPLAFGVVGLVDSTTARWLDNPEPMLRADLVTLLTRWVWTILDDTLRAGGIELDPDTPLTTPTVIDTQVATQK